MTSPQTAGPDRLLGQHTTWGLGVGLENAGWGWPASAVRSAGRCRPHGLAWAYATTRIGDYDRALAFEASLLAAVDAPRRP
jgi:hypothetical protein